MARRLSPYSRIRGCGGVHGTLKRRSLWPFTWLPMPRWKRPPLAAWMSRLMLATTIGLRGKATTMQSEEHTSELQSLIRSSYAVFCLKKKNNKIHAHTTDDQENT